MTSERRALEIAILVCPGYMPVDIIGFHTAFGLLPDVNLHLVWKNLDEIAGMPYFPTRATTTFEDCPADLDVLYAGAVPPEIFEDEDVLAFLADRGSRATWVAGVCAGSLLLGAAGLLLGYRATTNFQLHDNLAHYGAVPARGNVVEDRNRITAGPATGSFEIGLRLLQAFFGDDVARKSELMMEYAPRPLFGVGTPELAGPELTEQVLARSDGMGAVYAQVAERAARRLGVHAETA
ncbi:glutamine amidotransferase [Streptomyces chrestomyceticus JCM 4735]|uniref:Glutamine amidotransferase n=1 Tax=Streptomyces chrestomyceticus JCM 4735 TaxID=1306181 RepID=A0A7U9L3C6_9ACTN|nr:DJ-1/PfpI family protein [Streptomyces chrestomyceticus]GCD40294.1 glutamine amidotransferase [Streptomyces chrestomyceticus JCM 4735]